MSENRSMEDMQAQKKAEVDEPKLLQRPTVLVVIFALCLILLMAVVLPLRDSLSLKSWLGRATDEALALYAEMPEEPFVAAEYDPADRSLALYNYEALGDDPIPARVEVGRVALPENARLNTFRNARTLSGGVLFARKVNGSGLTPEWDGLYVNPASGLGELEEYLLQEAGEGVWYLINVPESLK